MLLCARVCAGLYLIQVSNIRIYTFLVRICLRRLLFETPVCCPGLAIILLYFASDYTQKRVLLKRLIILNSALLLIQRCLNRLMELVC